MTIRSIKDINDAYNEGRSHTQRFFKNTAANAVDGSWIDWSYASGQPGYDARIGTSLERTPVVATGNDAIWFPGISAGQERRLAGLTFISGANGANQTNAEAWLYDLVAVYPLIDGDNTDQQFMDNTAALPRYTDGSGLRAVLVNHVAPGVTAGGSHSINFTDAAGNTATATVGLQNQGVNRVGSAINGAPSGATADLYIPLNAPTGVRSINWLQFGTAPGGLWAIYLVKPIAFISHRAGASISQAPVMTEMCFCSERSFDLPVIPDGASLGFFLCGTGATRTISLVYGAARFIWG